MQKFFTIENINRFSVLGFSIGGRIALATLESFPDRIEKLTMIAGEGLRQNFWYNWATHRWLGKPIFRRMIHRPNMFFHLAKGAQHLRLVPRSTVLFASRMMDSIDNRHQVYATWILLSGFKMTKNKLAELANANSFDLMFVFGKHDLIMKQDEAELIGKVLPNAKVVLLDVGHHRLVKETLPYLIAQKEK
jgi:pimeloyl-ACP methyl ester carboxylesterase